MADATGEAKEPPLRVTFDRRLNSSSMARGSPPRRPARLPRAGRCVRSDRDGRIDPRRGSSWKEHSPPTAGPAAPGGLRPPRRLRRCQRCRAARPRSGDARHRRPGGHRPARGLDQPDGPLRPSGGDRGYPRALAVCPAPESTGCTTAAAGRPHPRHGQLREPDMVSRSSAWNGISAAPAYHPLFVFNHTATSSAAPPARQRPHRHHAEGWRRCSNR